MDVRKLISRQCTPASAGSSWDDGRCRVFKDTGGAPARRSRPMCIDNIAPKVERDGITFVRDAVTRVRALKAKGEGKPLWLWGGGNLFRQLADDRLVGWPRSRYHPRSFWAVAFP